MTHTNHSYRLSLLTAYGEAKRSGYEGFAEALAQLIRREQAKEARFKPFVRQSAQTPVQTTKQA